MSMNELKTRAVVLAAGKSTRFKTKKSKLLFNICGRSMILYPVKALEALDIPQTIILGSQAEHIKEEIVNAHIKNVTFVEQLEQKGTGHAVICSADTWDQENILIMSGDTPLVTSEHLRRLIFRHHEANAVVTFVTTMVMDPTGYGRIIEEDGLVQIVEEKDCSAEQRRIVRVNAGLYVIARDFLEKNINKLTPSPVTGEIYLVDLIKLASDAGLPVNMLSVPFDDVRGVNTLQELWEVEQIKRSELIRYWMHRGVRFELAQSIHLDIDIEIGAGSFIGTGVHLLRGTRIGEECFIGAFSIVANSVIGDETTVHSHSVIQDSTIGSSVHVGPFARIRENGIIGDNAEIGNFVELKNSTIGHHSKAKHLSYVGDAHVGAGVNIGAGTVTCNYDGAKKHKTMIEDGAFIGSNNTLVAPVHIGKEAYTAGGSVVTQEVPAQSLAIGRARQVNKIGYVQALKEKLAQGQDSHDEESDELEFNFCGAIKTETDHKEHA